MVIEISLNTKSYNIQEYTEIHVCQSKISDSRISKKVHEIPICMVTDFDTTHSNGSH